MKNMKKILALVLALMLVVGMVAALADTPTTGSITVKNAAKGETYRLYKIFDATVDGNGAISYTGTIPTALADYFTKDSVGVIRKNADKTDDAIAKAVAEYVNGLADADAMKTETGEGSSVVFSGLAFGYYGVKSTQGSSATVDSTNPNAVVYDKNSKTITVKKEVDDTSYSIGDTITYTATFDTVNYLGEGENAKQVINYEIQDTLPEFLSNVTVTSITVGGTAITTQQFSDKKISIPWATEDAGSNPKTYTNLYANGAKLVITYTAKLTKIVNFNTDNTNTVSIHPTTWNGTTEEKPWDESWQDDAKIKTYAAALQKVDENNNPLKGAIFTIKGLTVEPGDGAGIYVVTAYDANSDTQSAELTTDDNGKLYILGLKEGVDLTVTEVKAPDGYNKLDAPKSGVLAQMLTEKVYYKGGEIHYDAKGNVTSATSYATSETITDKKLTDLDAAALKIQNNKGTELPSTGGMGTTLFYIGGGILVLAAVILLVTKRRMNAND